MIEPLTLIACVVSIPLFLYALECFSLPLYREEDCPDTDASCVVLIPAHNEELVLAATLESINSQIGDGDSVLVVADNCTDATAEIARKAGCEVIERTHDTDRGKGFALAFGLDKLREAPPEIVIIVDADCDVAYGALQRLKNAVLQVDRPAQGRYLIQSSTGATIASKVSELAVMIRNRVRCKGMTALGIPVPLLGTGMAFKWQDITRVSLASGEIVEDMKLGVELARAGRGAHYVDSAVVTSAFPESDDAMKTQRERWEHGHLDILQRYVLPNLFYALKRVNFRLLFFTLDLAIPPLTLMLSIQIAFAGLFLVFGVFLGSYTPFLVFLLGLSLVSLALAFSWGVYGRTILSLQELGSIVSYIMSKMSIYKRFVKKRETKWIRTERDTKK